MQEKIERECKKCGKKYGFLWKEIARWMRNHKGQALDDWLCVECYPRGTHGESKVPLYVHWKSMFTRTRGKGDPHTLKYYVAKGIEVCLEWYDYLVFKKWAESNGFKPNSRLVLSRIDHSKDYCPENCRWITKENHVSEDWENRKNATKKRNQ